LLKLFKTVGFNSSHTRFIMARQFLLLLLVFLTISTAQNFNLILPHINWLADFDTCFNVLYTWKVMLHFPSFFNHRNHKIVPIVYFTNATSQLFLGFSRWTMCQTLSIVANFEHLTPSEINSYMGMAFVNLGFQRARTCNQYGL